MATEDRLLEVFLSKHPADAARLIERHSPARVAALVSSVSVDSAASAIGKVSALFAARCLEKLPSPRAAEVLSRLLPSDGANILRRVPVTAREEILRQCPSKLALQLQRLLTYPGNTVGALLDPHAPVVQIDQTAGEACGLADVDFFFVYVIDRGQKFRGVIPASALLASPPENTVSGLRRRKILRLSPTMPASAAAELPEWGEFDELPVVDSNNVFQGAIRHRTLRGRLTRRAQSSTAPRGGLESILALGEMYWVGLYGLIEGAALPPTSNSDTSVKGKAHE